MVAVQCGRLAFCARESTLDRRWDKRPQNGLDFIQELHFSSEPLCACSYIFGNDLIKYGQMKCIHVKFHLSKISLPKYEISVSITTILRIRQIQFSHVFSISQVYSYGLKMGKPGWVLGKYSKWFGSS